MESDPEIMNLYSRKLGLDTTLFSFHDVLSIEEWGLSMVPRPVLAVLMLFPVKDASEAFAADEQRRIDAAGQSVSDRVFYMKQTVGNACGTIAILHALLNGRDRGLVFESSSYLTSFLQGTQEKSPEAIAEYLESDDKIEGFHEEAAGLGQSENTDEECNSHFICFTLVDGCVYELDGRKKGPINHGASSSDSFLEDCCEVVKLFMARDPEETRFTLVALAQTEAGC